MQSKCGIYTIQIVITKNKDNVECIMQIPTFLIEGCSPEEARNKALSLWDCCEGLEIHGSVMRHPEGDNYLSFDNLK